MAIDKIFNNSSIDDLADNVLSEVDDFMLSVEKMQKRKVAGNVQLVIQALKKIDNDIREKYDGVTTVIEKRVSTIKDGKDGQNGANGRDGKDGRPGRDGAIGPRGVDGLNGSNGRDGEDGVSVTNAFIDFDGSLVINLSDGQSLNVGEVVAPDLAEKIKVITNGGGTSQGVLDTLTSLQNQINLISSALVYKGTWNASTNTPALASGVGTANSFYIVSVAGSTTLNGISNWGVGDWATFNGTAWQRVEGGAAGNFTTLTTSGAATIQSLTVGRGGGGWSDSAAVGVNALFANTTGISNTAVGYLTLTSNLTGNRNTAVGSTAGYNISGSDNTAVGNTAGFSNTTGSRNVMLGNFAGAYELGSDSFYVDSRDRTNTAGDKAGALLYGTFSATPASQTLKINAALTATYDVTLSAGTANGVTYLNGSKVLTTGSALTFDGTNFRNTSGAFEGIDNMTLSALVSTTNATVLTLNSAGTSGTTRFQINSTEKMRLTATSLYTASGVDVGIGTSSPAAKLDVNGSTRATGLTLTGSVILAGASQTTVDSLVGTASRILAWGPNTSTAGTLYLGTISSDASVGSTSAVVLNGSGNLGLGVTPSAWGSGYKALQINNGGIVTNTGGTFTAVTANAYFDGTNYRYVSTAAASLYRQNAGTHDWQIAASGTAGDAITFTQAMTLDASGNLGVGTTSPSSFNQVVNSPHAVIGTGSTSAPGLTLYGSIISAPIIAFADGTTGNQQYRGYIQYNHGDDSLAFATAATERARITSGGYFKASSTGAYLGSTGGYHELRSNTDNNNAVIVTHAGTDGTQYGISIRTANDQNDSTRDFLECQGGGVLRAQIRTNGGIANYSANDVNLSDRREKTNFAPAKSYLDTICAIPVQTFNYIDQNMEEDGGLTLGVVAQDVQAVAPELVMESNWGSKEDPKMRLSIYQTDLQYALMKALQELKAEFDAYKASHP